MIMVINGNKIKETEKALNIEVYFYIDGQTYTWMMWFPKSRISIIDDNKYEVEDWLMSKFEKELYEKSSNNKVVAAARLHSINYQF